jgi:hypothetical protein
MRSEEQEETVIRSTSAWMDDSTDWSWKKNVDGSNY